MSKLFLFLFLFCAGFAGVFLWLTIDEPLAESTREWLEAGRINPRLESLDYIYLVGLTAPEGENPIEYGRALLRRVETDPFFDFDLTTELLNDLPCEPANIACWKQSETPWPDEVLQANRHILERWQSYPVHGDFVIPATGPTFTVLTPVIQLADKLLYLDLVNHWHHGKLDEDIEALTWQVEHLAQVPREAEDLLSVLMIQAIVRSRMNHLMVAIRWGGDPGTDFSQNKLHEPFDTQSILARWARRELQVIDHLSPHFGWPLGVASQRNRTLNRARQCVEEVVKLADREELLKALESGFGDCGGLPLRLRNWKGDQIVNWTLLVDDTTACRAHLANLYLELSTALLESRMRFDNPEARIAHVAKTNPFGPEAGVLLRDEQVCYAVPNKFACTNICLAAPFEVEETSDSHTGVRPGEA